ncbi:MAG: hypothetical protein JXC32_02750 [Anaerolineae bacterium]|nr:hypothetical protein [Anaerolineae bacterium]
MPYRHYGNIGDVWKHLPLCEVLAIEQPTAYIETNAAYAAYALEGTPRQRYGVGHTYAHANRAPAVDSSRYLALLRAVNAGLTEPRTYLGSSALAMQILGDSCERYILLDIEAPALANDVAYAGALGLTGKVETLLGDSIAGTLSMLPRLERDVFIHIDPYAIFEPNVAGQTYFDVFLATARRGIRCMLWYGYFTGNERALLATRIRDAIVDGPGVTAGQVYGVDVTMALLQPDTIVANPGIVGCTVLTANLSQASREAVAALGQGLVTVYEDDVTFEEHPGRLRMSVLVL